MGVRRMSLWGYVAVGAAFLVLPLFAGAQDTEQATSPMRVLEDEGGNERRQAVEENMASATGAFRDRLEVQRREIRERLQDRLYNLTENIVNRMEAALFRLENIAGRMEARARILEESGLNVEPAYEHIQSARQAMRDAKSIVEGDLAEFAMSDAPQEEFMAVKAEFKRVVDLIRSARESLRAGLAVLKSAAASMANVAAPGSAMEPEAESETP